MKKQDVLKALEDRLSELVVERKKYRITARPHLVGVIEGEMKGVRDAIELVEEIDD